MCVYLSAEACKEAIRQYYLNPNYCKFCENIIECNRKQLTKIRQRQFCSLNCFHFFSKKQRSLIEKKKKRTLEEYKRTRLQNSEDFLKKRTLEAHFNESKNYFSGRSNITKIAQRIMKNSERERKCGNCGYLKHVEVAHVKSVASFSKDSTLYDVNRLENLIYLCPNCHWEFDNHILKI